MHPDFLIPIAGMVTGLILFLPIVRATVRVIEKRAGGNVDSSELAELRDAVRLIHERLDNADYAHDRIGELEERLDFTERMLAQQERKQVDNGLGG